jgi:hypothetical protein
MEKTKTIRGNKVHASKIRMFFENLSEYKSNPCKLTCDCDKYYYFINQYGELDAITDTVINLNDYLVLDIETILFCLRENLKESYKNVQNMEKVKCSNKAQSYVDYFDDILKEMSEVHQRKNADYGNNFHKRYEKYGFLTALLRLTDKMERLENIYEKGEIQVKDESVEDTLLDLANYAVMTIVELKNKKKETE